MICKTAFKISQLILFTMFISCRGRNNIKTTVTENNGELTIQVDANKNWKDIHYDKTFDIRGMTKSQRDSIVHHVFDSLHLGINEFK